ncbi:MAG: energy transducer TonB [Mariprofundaceae bacterium]|nr:energy transducer TonB [Mariprofundaceae bacterium]
MGISVALHALLFLRFGGVISAPVMEQAVSGRMITRVNLIASARPPRHDISKPVPAEVEPVPPKPVHRARLRPVHETRKKPEHKSQTDITQVASAPALVDHAAVDEGVIRQLRQQYLARVMAHIERYKYYPSTARRRRIQGDVRVSFLLLHDGTVRAVKASGNAVLGRAAQQAVLKAQPLPKPPAGNFCPMHCEFSIRYVLK